MIRKLVRNLKSDVAVLAEEIRRMEKLRARATPIRAYMSSQRPHCLHIGAGGNVLPGWLNTDLEPQTADIVFLDVTEPLPFGKAALDFIFTEHLIEHLPHELGAYHLGECFRVLRPGGRLRVATPDLQFLIDIYTQDPHTEIQAKYIKRTLTQAFPQTGFYSGAFVLNHFVRHWGHQFIYDEKTLFDAMQRAGFTSICRWSVGESDEPLLRNIEHHGDAISDEFNRMQTIVVEGTK